MGASLQVSEILLRNKVPNHYLLLSPLSQLDMVAKLPGVGTLCVSFAVIFPKPRDYPAHSEYSIKLTEGMDIHSREE